MIFILSIYLCIFSFRKSLFIKKVKNFLLKFKPIKSCLVLLIKLLFFSVPLLVMLCRNYAESDIEQSCFFGGSAGLSIILLSIKVKKKDLQIFNHASLNFSYKKPDKIFMLLNRTIVK